MTLIKRLSCITVLAMMLSACATPYDTQKGFWTFGKGFETTQIAADSWQISFVGNDSTDRALTRKYIMRKAAELCHQAGYPYFTYTTELTNRDAVNQFGVATHDDNLLFGSSSVGRETSSVVEVTGLKSKTQGQQNRIYDTEFILSHLKFDD